MTGGGGGLERLSLSAQARLEQQSHMPSGTPPDVSAAQSTPGHPCPVRSMSAHCAQAKVGFPLRVSRPRLQTWGGESHVSYSVSLDASRWSPVMKCHQLSVRSTYPLYRPRPSLIFSHTLLFTQTNT
uniref:Uncharacterized protein n=1 Tax=Timema cristinae TaxID=61476 RepID=A0A7R9H9B9_TIMCR|nr:unnamed protein product [Timema cristinae]